jgi:hypothetical protein
MRAGNETHRTTRRERWMRGAAAFVAVVLLLAQTAGAAHRHPLPSPETYAAPAAVSLDNGLCSLCLVRFHSPLAFVIAPHPAAPLAERWSPRRLARVAPHFAYRSHLFGRAPPAPV